MIDAIRVLRPLYRLLPAGMQSLARDAWSRMPFTAAGRHERWVRDVYFRFGREERRRIFLSCARFLHINRPITGYYFEFGCHGAYTMRMAWDMFHRLFDLTYVGFDSFEGLPEIAEIDRQEIWEKGKLATGEESFRRTVVGHGMPEERLLTVRGFYDATLNQALRDRLSPRKAAVIYIDCDLYASTVPILRFIADFLQPGTIIVFDDWFCFMGDPEKGERRAWAEFRREHPHLRFEPFVATNEAQAFICVGTAGVDDPPASRQ